LDEDTGRVATVLGYPTDKLTQAVWSGNFKYVWLGFATLSRSSAVLLVAVVAHWSEAAGLATGGMASARFNHLSLERSATRRSCSVRVELENGREVKLDPEERVITAALDESGLDDHDERGAGARIEFMPEGHAKVTITISRGLVEQAKSLNFATWELFAEAIRAALPGAFELTRPFRPSRHWRAESL
jgi:hypothetical protein